MEPNDEKKTVDKEEESNNAGAALIALGIFAYNSYVIFHNLQVHDGYLWVVGGIVVNLGIAIALLRDWGSPFAIVRNLALIVAFIVASAIGYTSGDGNLKEALAKESVSIVDQIIARNLGANAPKCTHVEIGDKKDDNTYNAKAFLNNNEALDIFVKYNEKTNYIEVEIPNREPTKDELEKEAVALVNRLVKDDMGPGTPKCTGVEITSKRSDGTYEAGAFFDSNESLKIVIRYYKKTGNVEVTVQE